MDFGAAIISQSKFGKHPALLFDSNGVVFEFIFVDQNPGTAVFYYKCHRCFSMKRKDRTLGPVPRVKVEAGRYKSDPVNTTQPHYCQARATGTVLGARARYELLNDVKGGGQKPLQAFMNKLVEIDGKQDLTEEQKVAMSTALVGPSGYKGFRTTISRAKNSSRPAHQSVESIRTEGLRTSNGEAFMQFISEDAEILIFASKQVAERALSLGCKNVLGDGCYPFGLDAHGKNGQLYTLMLAGTHKAYPVLFALTKRASSSAYAKILLVLRDCFSSTGFDRFSELNFMFDFEAAMIKACGSVFPEATIRGCSFHYSQAIVRKRDSLGLRDPEVGPGGSKASLQEWFAQFRALFFLPVNIADLYFENRLRFPPPDYPQLQPACEAFVSYFRDTWLRNSLFRGIWSHWMNNGTRTNNLIEGYHNRIKGLFGDVVRPDLGRLTAMFRDFECFSRRTLEAQLAGGREETRDAKQIEREAFVESCLNELRAKMATGVIDCDFIRDILLRLSRRVTSANLL